MLTTLWDQWSLGTACTTWCLSADHAYLLTSTSLRWGAWRNIGMSTAILPSYVNDYKKPSRKHKCSPHLMLKDRSNTMTGRLMPFYWRQVTWSWWRLMLTRGRGKSMTGGRRNHMKRNTELLKESLCTSWRTSGQDVHEFYTKTVFSHPSCRGDSPLYDHMSWVGQVHHHYPRGMDSRREWDWGSAMKCKLSATSPTADSWDSSRLCKQKALCYPSDIFQSTHVGSRVESSM